MEIRQGLWLLCLAVALAPACEPVPDSSSVDAARDLAQADAAPDRSGDSVTADLAAGDAHRAESALDRAPADAPAQDSHIATDQAADLKAGDAWTADALSWLSQTTCATAAPPGAALADPFPKYSGGTCPKLAPGMNSVSTSGTTRKFILVYPKAPVSGEVFPLIFMWHWLKGSASSFLSKGEVQAAVDSQRFIAVIPESKGDLDLFGLVDLPWPFTTLVSQKRMDEEYTFFDDMLACVALQYAVNKECVSTAGVSAGALFAAQLAQTRSKHLSSLISLSGGVGSGGLVNSFIRTWKSPAHKLPTLVLWGGPLDSCILLNFQVASQELEKQLMLGGHFFVECVHNCKHGEPPVTPTSGKSKYEPIWQFAFQHPYWLKAGTSPLQVTGWPSSIISWCGLGQGSAKIRTGPCDPPGCPM